KQPSDQIINPGSTAQFAVEAQGDDLTDRDLTYQWYLGQAGDTSNPISGATGKAYTTPALTAAAQYWVRVNDASGNCPTNSVTVTARICQPVQILFDPVSKTIASGQSAELSVDASGDGIGYQWQKLTSGWSDVSGAHARTLTVASADA